MTLLRTVLEAVAGAPLTPAELAGQLAKRGYPDELGERVLDRLASAGLIDDADFAEQLVRSRRERGGKGARVLTAELRAKGVDDSVITQVLGAVDPAAERDRAEQLVREKLRRQALGDDDLRVTRRLVAMLVRRGYNPGMAYDAVTTELGAERERRRV